MRINGDVDAIYVLMQFIICNHVKDLTSTRERVKFKFSHLNWKIKINNPAKRGNKQQLAE
jgi:hypothetical protein